ncbi:hypothetical protein QTP86_009707, partial [Hemibagrus guttatus]
VPVTVCNAEPSEEETQQNSGFYKKFCLNPIALAVINECYGTCMFNSDTTSLLVKRFFLVMSSHALEISAVSYQLECSCLHLDAMCGKDITALRHLIGALFLLITVNYGALENGVLRKTNLENTRKELVISSFSIVWRMKFKSDFTTIQSTRRVKCFIDRQLVVGTCEIVMLNRDSSQPKRTIARQTARCACRRGQIAGTTRARPACVDGDPDGFAELPDRNPGFMLMSKK